MTFDKENKSAIRLNSDRIYLQEISQDDYKALSKILQDEEVMYAYNGAFSDEETQNWLDNQLKRYNELGFGLWAVILKETGEMIGQCGLTIQDCKEQKVLEIGYLFQKKFWHKGYATEAAKICKEYAFKVLEAESVYCIIRDTNIASQNVALRLGMKKIDSFTKHYRGIEMPHYLYQLKNVDVKKVNNKNLENA